MREIKFRAWWKHINTMQYFDTLAFLNFDDDVLMYQEIPEEVPHGIGRIDNTQILMQYTGLKDKNGTEIYEGDVVKGRYYAGYNIGIKGIIGNVSWTSASFKVNGVKQYEGTRVGLDWSFEVIGNIYEHPELLKGQSQ